MPNDKKNKILILEDEEVARYLNENILASEGYETTATYNVENTKELLKDHVFDLLVLDLKLPDGCGLELISWVKDLHPNLPIIIVSVLHKPDDRAKGLNIGADDYLIKPFHPYELIHRVNNLLRHSQTRNTYMIDGHQIGQLVLNTGHRKLITAEGEEISLTRGEAILMERLSRSIGQDVSREILQEIVARNKDGHPRTVDVLVSRLRAKLKENDLNMIRISSVPEIGYRLDLH
ncbi:Transcriptional regulatory protein ompR [Candidatus Terasakiella magnetica]|uniref:Transcriptional regulatory protein ompR n=1 Tax=Candidatus Terasakiella magnetica TaxID=1867952 RepID=A0A1C3RJ11_9PROT|nr:response regulator transcription factor [Candidatus Terasakiella magnetica]SCA57252.1 Transcriptional regulatory protein ompR [Candidatus Terasakiella magnetica]